MSTALKVWFKDYWLVLLIIAFYIVINWPDALGRSFYTSNELPRDLGMLKAMAAGHFIFLGPDSSIGSFHFGAMYYYLSFPIVWLFRFAPYSLAVCSLLFFSLTIFTSFIVAKRWWQNELFAYVVIMLMASSIFTFQFSQYGSNPNYIPFFSLIFFYCLERLIAGKRSYWYTAILAASFAISAQLHIVPLLSLPIILLCLLVTRKLKPTFWDCIIFFAIVLIINAPYLYYEFTHSFVNIRTFSHSVTGGSGFYTPIWIRLLQYIGFWLVPVISIHDYFDIIYILGMDFIYYVAAALVLLLPILKYESTRLLPKQLNLSISSSVKTTLLYWLIIPSLVIVLPSASVNGLRIYYFLMLYPLIFFLMAWGLLKLWQKGFVRSVAYLCLIYAILQITQIYEYRHVVHGLITWVYG